MFAFSFLAISGLMLLLSARLSFGLTNDTTSSEFFQVIVYKDDLCHNAAYAQITQLNYCAPSSENFGEFVKVSVQNDTRRSLYHVTETYYIDPECSQLSFSEEPNSKIFPSLPCQGSVSAQIISAIPLSPPENFDISFNHYDNEAHCSDEENYSVGLNEVVYLKFKTNYNYLEHKVRFNSCSASGFNGNGYFEGTEIPILFTVNKTEACQSPIGLGTTVFDEVLTFTCYH
jgi:hypothetical protein